MPKLKQIRYIHSEVPRTNDRAEDASAAVRRLLARMIAQDIRRNSAPSAGDMAENRRKGLTNG